MTPQELQKALDALASKVGSKSYVAISIQSRDRPFEGHSFVSIYPYGITHGASLHEDITGSFSDALLAIEDKWDKMAADHHAETIRKMALEIIRITADQGECTDAALRAEFDAVEVEAFSEQAVDMANEMASNGPFSIVRLAGANAA